MITLTKLAINKIKEIALKEGIDLLLLRIKVVGFGCAGFGHDISFASESEIRELDEIIEQDNIRFILDPISAQYLNGAEIDYIESLMGGGFKFNSPNATGSCGCGKSVIY